MADSDHLTELKRWIGNINKTHGYGGVFNAETATDKVAVETNTAARWCETISAEFGLTVGVPEHNSNDPPDFYVFVEGKLIGVELVQLVDFDHKRRAAKDETPHMGQLFSDMQWSQERLVRRLTDIVRCKGKKYEPRDVWIDVLVIHTAETWLSSCQARAWLNNIEIEPHPHIASAFLLFEYEPGNGVQHWPGFWIYGDFGRMT